MRQEFAKSQLLENWIEVSQRLIECITEDQYETVLALLDLREKLLGQLQTTKETGEITADLCVRADRIEKEVYYKMNSKVDEIRRALQASNRQKQLNSYDGYEKNDVKSILNFYK